MSDIITLADKRDTYHFTVGQPLVWDDGVWRAPRLGHRLRAAWRRLTWWRQARHVTTEIDVEAGCITVAPLRWSWLRWRWVRS